MTLAQMECKAIEMALKRNNFAITETAKELDIARATLYRKMKEYGIKQPEKKTDEKIVSG